MSKTIHIFTIILLISGISAFAEIYDADDRKDLFQYKHDPRVADWARSIALVVRKSEVTTIVVSGTKRYYLKGKSYSDTQLASEEPLCEGERFQKQKVVGRAGTGFLVKGDLFFTAGHVIEAQEVCDDVFIIFDYKESEQGGSPLWYTDDSVFECKELIVSVVENQGEEIYDYAAIKMSSAPLNRKGLKLASDKINDHTPLIMIGHGFGFPLKVVENDSIIENSRDTVFVSLLDNFAGNSGGPIQNRITGEVEGLLIEGEYSSGTGMKGDWPGGCWFSKVYCTKPDGPYVCDETNYRGATAARISNLTTHPLLQKNL